MSGPHLGRNDARYVCDRCGNLALTEPETTGPTCAGAVIWGTAHAPQKMHLDERPAATWLPAAVVEAGYTALDYENGLWLHNPAEGVWALIPRKRVAERVLSAALPVLAESPELIERLAYRLYTRNRLDRWGDMGDWRGESEAHKETWRDIARVDLRALFAAPTEGTEENR